MGGPWSIWTLSIHMSMSHPCTLPLYTYDSSLKAPAITHMPIERLARNLWGGKWAGHDYINSLFSHMRTRVNIHSRMSTPACSKSAMRKALSSFPLLLTISSSSHLRIHLPSSSTTCCQRNTRSNAWAVQSNSWDSLPPISLVAASISVRQHWLTL